MREKFTRWLERKLAPYTEHLSGLVLTLIIIGVLMLTLGIGGEIRLFILELKIESTEGRTLGLIFALIVFALSALLRFIEYRLRPKQLYKILLRLKPIDSMVQASKLYTALRRSALISNKEYNELIEKAIGPQR